MILKELKPRKALNKAFLKVKPNRPEIENFKSNPGFSEGLHYFANEID